MLKQSAVWLFAFASLSVGCQVGEVPTNDELAGESEADGEAYLAAAASDSSFTYYTVEADARRCVSPLCGGFWVSRLNRTSTECADGSLEASCYVAEINFDDTGLSDSQIEAARDQELLLRGTITAREYGSFGNLGQLSATEVWVAGSKGEASGTFVRVSDSGIRCITTPCYNTFREAKLNSVLTADASELDLSSTGASDEEISRAFEHVFSSDGLIVAGLRYWFSGGGTWQAGRLATQFYERVSPSTASASCVVTGCSSQVCGEESVTTTCEWRPEYACYRSATCERQADGGCGWTDTPELAACLASPPNP